MTFNTIYSFIHSLPADVKYGNSQLLFPYRAFKRDHGEILRYGNSFPPNFTEVLLAHASPNDWPSVGHPISLPDFAGLLQLQQRSAGTPGPATVVVGSVCVGKSVNRPGKKHHGQWGSPQAVSKLCDSVCSLKCIHLHLCI